MPLIPGTLFSNDPQKEPAFEKNTVVILTENYTKLSGLGTCSKYLTKDAACIIKECAIFSYTFDDKTQEFTKKLNDIEWCYVEIGTPVADFFEEEDYVKAKDLKKYVFKRRFY